MNTFNLVSTQSKSTQYFIDCSNEVNAALKQLNTLHLDVIDVVIASKTIKIAMPPRDFKIAEIGGFKSIIKNGMAINTAKIGSVKVMFEQVIIPKAERVYH